LRSKGAEMQRRAVDTRGEKLRRWAMTRQGNAEKSTATRWNRLEKTSEDMERK
jgi:hypothetical protein